MVSCTLEARSFRCYDFLELHISCPWVVFTGPNGIGKTSILEGLSLFSPGKGLRGGTGSAFQKHGQTLPWYVSLCLETLTGPLKMETYEEAGRRKVRINEAPVRSQAHLTEWISVVWATAAWSDSSSARRSYLNRLIFTLEPSYGELLIQYDKALKQRMLLLIQGEGAGGWLESLEKIIAETGISILRCRETGLDVLAKELRYSQTPFPTPLFQSAGEVEDLWGQGDFTAEAYMKRLKERRAPDQIRKTTTFGVHKTHFSLIHPHGREAALCSAGEQKGLLLSIALAVVRLTYQRLPGNVHFFLLDEAMAHLDRNHQEWLWQEIKSLPVFSWMTGLDELKVPEQMAHLSLPLP